MSLFKNEPHAESANENREPQIPAVGDRWICVEFMIKCNTVGKADGEQDNRLPRPRAVHRSPCDPRHERHPPSAA